MRAKTKTVDRFELPASSFAYVGDPDATSTWKLPIYFPSDFARTVEHIKNARSRFADTKGIPDAERMDVWFTLRGAAMAHGIHVEQRERVTVQQPTPEVSVSKLSTRRLKELEAMADAKADELLAAMGIE